MKFKSFVIPAAAVAMLAACAMPHNAPFGPFNLAEIAAMQPQGTAFQKAAHAEYVSLAQIDAAEFDWNAASYHLTKAETSANGTTVYPISLAERDIPAEHMGALTDARARLMGKLEGGSREAQPTYSARAQAMFDCWTDEAEENHQPEDIAKCRDGFESAYAKLSGPSVAPQPAMEQVGGPWNVFFDMNSVALDAQAMNTVAEVVATAQANPGAKFVVRGYTDTVGNAAYNKRLSERRAMEVGKALSSRGVEGTKLSEEAFGEENLAVPTDDNVANRQNRRAVIILVK